MIQMFFDSTGPFDIHSYCHMSGSLYTKLANNPVCLFAVVNVTVLHIMLFRQVKEIS